MKRTSRICFAIAVLVCASGCKKEEGSPGHPAPPHFTHPVRFWCTGNQLVATQTFTVDAATGDTLETSGHSKIVFEPAAFITSAGAPASGAVRVKVLAIMDVADMVLMNKTPVGYNNGTLQLLKSGGELKITADQDNVEVGIVPDHATVMLPGSDPDAAMRIWHGTQNPLGDLTWTTTNDTAYVVPDSDLEALGEGDWFYYMRSIDALGWIHCATPPPGTTTTFDVAVPAGFDADNALVWVVMPVHNAAVPCVGASFRTRDLPIGEAAIIVSLAEMEDGQYYASFTNITIADGLAPSLTYQATTLAQFEAAVRAL